MEVKLNLAIRASIRERYGLYWTVPLLMLKVPSAVLLNTRLKLNWPPPPLLVSVPLLVNVPPL